MIYPRLGICSIDLLEFISRICDIDIQINICAEYWPMLPRPRLVCRKPGLRAMDRSPGVPDKSSRSPTVLYDNYHQHYGGDMGTQAYKKD